jgi:WD40 repeat protein
VVTVSPNQGNRAIVSVWDLATGKRRYVVECGYFVHDVAFSPDGYRLVVLCGDTGNVYQAATGKRLRGLKHPRESQLACFSPDGTVLATCSTGGLIHLWDPIMGTKVGQPLRCADGVLSLAFSPDGQCLVAASYDGTARVWTLKPPERSRPYAYDCGRADHMNLLLGNADPKFRRVKFSPDGRREVRYGGSPGARLGDRGGTGPGVRLDQRLPVTQVRFSPDGGRVLTQDTKGTVRWWDAATGKPAAPEVSLGAELYSCNISADGKRLLTVEEGPQRKPVGRVVTVWDVDHGRYLVGPLREWDTGPQRFGEPELRRQITQAALSPDGTRLVLASDATGTLGVWDVDTARELTRTLGYRGLLYKVEFSADGQRYLTFGSDTVAQLWSPATGEPAGPPLRHPSFCRYADLAEDGWHVATVDGEQVIRLWDGRTGDLLGRIDRPARSNLLWFSRDGRRLVIDGGERVLDLPSYRGTSQELPTLLQLLTGLQRDPGGGIGPVDPQAFRSDPDRYCRAWQGWRSRVEAASPAVSAGHQVSISLTIFNNTDRVAAIHWKNPQGQLQRFATLKPQEQYRQQTFSAHEWVAVFEGRGQQTFVAPRSDTTWELRGEE